MTTTSVERVVQYGTTSLRGLCASKYNPKLPRGCLDNSGGSGTTVNVLYDQNQQRKEVERSYRQEPVPALVRSFRLFVHLDVSCTCGRGIRQHRLRRRRLRPRLRLQGELLGCWCRISWNCLRIYSWSAEIIARRRYDIAYCGGHRPFEARQYRRQHFSSSRRSRAAGFHCHRCIRDYHCCRRRAHRSSDLERSPWLLTCEEEV